jgi:hypothetical protein
MSKQYPPEGTYKYLSARGVAATGKIVTKEEGPRVIKIQNTLKAVTYSFLRIDIKLMTHKSKITRIEETK